MEEADLLRKRREGSVEDAVDGEGKEEVRGAL